jgi:Protein of unknown function (DUF2568)
MTMTQRVNLTLRALMELGVVGGFGYWGFVTGNSLSAKLLLGIGAPAVGFGFWGAVDFHQAGRAAEALRLGQELLVSGLAAVAWYAGGSAALGVALAALSLTHHAMVYLLGDRLLTAREPGLAAPPAGDEPR